MKRAWCSTPNSLYSIAIFSFALGCVELCAFRAQAQTTLLNVSYDPTRELYKEINPAFSAAWKAQTGETVVVATSHDGSGAQARAVLDGQQADVVTLGLSADVDVLARHGLVDPAWESKLPNHGTPYISTVVFLVRKGNPKNIHDWPDLVRDGTQVITANPKTSSGGRWNYLAAYVWALHAPGGSKAKAEAFLANLYHHVPVLDSGARGSTNTFVQRGQGDVLLAWEDEALLASKDLGADKFDAVYPPVSVKAEPSVAVVDKIANQRGTAKVAHAYLQFLYGPTGQEIAAKHHYRPIDPQVLAAHAEQFPKLTTYDVASLGGWTKVQAEQFADGGVFDRIYTPGK